VGAVMGNYVRWWHSLLVLGALLLIGMLVAALERFQKADAIIYALLVGATLGSAITYLIVTHEKRIVRRVRRSVDLFASYHDWLTQSEREKGAFRYELRRSLVFMRMIRTLFLVGAIALLSVGAPYSSPSLGP
jgi:hypothetical protein